MARVITAMDRFTMHKTTPAALRRPQVARLLWGQALVILCAVLLSWVSKGSGAALSALCGGLVCLLPNLFFAWRSLRVTGARYAQAMVKAFYQAEAGKFGLTAVLFAFFFIAVPPSNPALFFCAY
ncbi:MAG: ATP synthase subunit I, partial [Cobetia marina]